LAHGPGGASSRRELMFNPSILHFFSELFGNWPARAIFFVLQMPLYPLVNRRIFGHCSFQMPFLIHFYFPKTEDFH
jgi:hypothetical protein